MKNFWCGFLSFSPIWLTFLWVCYWAYMNNPHAFYMTVLTTGGVMAFVGLGLICYAVHTMCTARKNTEEYYR